MINVNENQFRIFFTDDKITCFLCKSVGHTTTNCKKNIGDKFKSDRLSDSNVINTMDTTTKVPIENTLPPPTTDLDLLEQTTMDWSKKTELYLIPWWNHDCNESIKLYKKCLNKFKKSKSTLDHIQLKKARAYSRYITKKSKTEVWKKYTSFIYINTSSTEIWNKIKAIKGISYHRLPSILQYNNTPLSTSSYITKVFAKIFQKNSNDSNYDPVFARSKTVLKTILQMNQS